MTASVESPMQYERDIRGANVEWKRTKDSSEKWARGTRPSPGVWETFDGTTGSESQQAKFRPRKRHCDRPTNAKESHNHVKPRMNWSTTQGLAGRMRTNFYAKGEITEAVASRSISDLPSPGAGGFGAEISSNILYSFDRRDSPGRPLTLDVFVKAPTARDTERLVAKEYEVLDANGESMTGRKARRHLRQTMTDLGPARGDDAGGGETVVEDEGFELV